MGADPALVNSAASRLRPSGFDRGEEAWRKPLIAFYERDELPQRAANLRNGAAFDYMDRRTIKALQAAVIYAMVEV